MCRHFAESCRTFEVLRLLGEKPTSFFSLQMDANGNVLEAARSCGARGGGDRHRRLAPQLELARDQLQIFAIGKNVASIQPITSPVKFARAPCTIITTMWHLGRLFFVRHRGDRTQTGEAQRIPPPQRRHRGLHSEPELCLRAHYGFSMNSPMLSDLCFRLVTFEGSHQRL